VTLHSLPLFVRLTGRAVILIGEGEGAAAKRRLLERAGAAVVGEEAPASLAIVAVEDDTDAAVAVARLRARRVLVNAVDRPELCDFTLPAIVDRAPVLVAIGTGGVSAGLAAALRQRLEALLPARIGRLAEALHAARPALRAAWPNGADRRRALARVLAAGGDLDPLAPDPDVTRWLGTDRPGEAAERETVEIVLRSADPDDLTLREARWLANADRVVHDANVPVAVLDRARADAVRLRAPAAAAAGLTAVVRMG